MILTDILLVGLHISILGSSYYLFRAAGLSLSRFSIPMLLYVKYIAFSFVGIPGYYFGWFVGYQFYFSLLDRELAQLMWLLSAGCLLSLVTGFVFSRHILGMRLKVALNQTSRFYSLKAPLFLIALCVIVFIIYIRLLPTIPIVELFKNGPYAAHVARSQATNDFPGRMAYYEYFFSGLLSFISFYLVGVAIRHQDKRAKLVALGCTLLCLCVTIHTTAKGPLISYLVGLVATYFLLTKMGHIPIKTILKTGLVLFAVAVIIVYFIVGGGVNSFKKSVGFTVERILGGQVASLYWSMALVKYETGLLYGRNFPNPRGIFPWEHYPLNRETALFMREIRGSKTIAIVSSAPAVFWSTVYADFGVIGALICAFCLGVFVYWLHATMAVVGQLSPLRAALIAWTALDIAQLSGTSINMILPIPTDLIVVLLGATLLYASNTHRNRARNKSRRPEINARLYTT
ncbi:MAG: O-antigen polymerase [Candidatus Ranarchaeia archaeon]